MLLRLLHGTWQGTTSDTTRPDGEIPAIICECLVRAICSLVHHPIFTYDFQIAMVHPLDDVGTLVPRLHNTEATRTAQ
jgi:hypothetical protein